MKISKNRIKLLIKEAMENINERMDMRGFDSIEIPKEPPVVDIPPPIVPPEENSGGGGGPNYSFLMGLSRKLFNHKGFDKDLFGEQIRSFKSLISFSEGVPDSIVLEKNIFSSDGQQINISFTADFESLEATIFVSCFNDDEEMTDIVDGFSKRIANEKNVQDFIVMEHHVERLCRSLSLLEIIDMGKDLLNDIKSSNQ